MTPSIFNNNLFKKVVCFNKQITFLITILLLSVLLSTSTFAASTDSITSDTITDSPSVNNISEDTLIESDSGSMDIFDSLYEDDSETAIASIDTEIIDSETAISISKLETETVNDTTYKKSPQKSKEKLSIIVKKTVSKIKDKVFKLLIILLLVILILIIWYYLSRHFDKDKFLTSTRLSLMDKEVQVACRYMEKNYYNPGLNVDSICTEMVTGAAFLEAIFEKELGMSVDDFLMQVRVNRARTILDKDSSVPITDLSASVGYVDTEQFEKDFKISTGITIDAYIQTI